MYDTLLNPEFPCQGEAYLGVGKTWMVLGRCTRGHGVSRGGFDKSVTKSVYCK